MEDVELCFLAHVTCPGFATIKEGILMLVVSDRFLFSYTLSDSSAMIVEASLMRMLISLSKEVLLLIVDHVYLNESTTAGSWIDALQIVFSS